MLVHLGQGHRDACLRICPQVVEADLHGGGVDVRRPGALPDRPVAQAEDVCKGETNDWGPRSDCCHGAPVGLVADVSCHPVGG